MNIKRLISFILLIMFSLPFINIKNIEANSELQVMKTSTGSDLTYRGSSEKVYGLKDYDYPTQDYRAAWVSTFVSDIPSYSTEAKFKSDANQILTNMENMGMNAIVFHVRTHNNALYNSDLNPLASWWALVDFETFDPLAWLIDECHRRGFEFHAWMNPYRVKAGSSTYCHEVYPDANPANNESLLLSNGSTTILDPASSVVQKFLVDTCMEFLDRYDADAIHFDDYFYISGVSSQYSDNEKRGHINSFIKSLSDAIYDLNIKEQRAVQLGIAPSGIYRNGSYTSSPRYDADGTLTSPTGSNTSGMQHYGNYLFADTKKWVDEEWIDYITPQTYWGIEHSVASFAELSRWWSWVTKYKNVNLYLGSGIYMAESSGSSAVYWQRNNDEVKNQLLISSQYEEVKGMCFYKYSTLLNQSNTIIKNGVNLISNEYWAKRIPGVVINKYKDHLPVIKPTNIQNITNTITWDKIDNVFGYMVYQVEKGQTLDQQNIDHVLVYTQDNKVTNIDTTKYDYYISSVNRANVISEPVKFGAIVLSNVDTVKTKIANLPLTITLDQETEVNEIRTLYNALTQAEKNEITNYAILTSAEARIQTLKSMKKKVDDFLKTVDTNIVTNRILPVGENMKWTYKNVEDAKSYNITTGEKLKTYLSSYTITLYLELTENDITYKQEVLVDLSLVEKGKLALIYRNDPSSMSEDHIGECTGTSKFIGWADATITVDKYVLFIAKNNFIELENATITPCNWTSCAGVYHNTSSNEITFTLGETFATTSNYGYFIVGANKQVKMVKDTSTESDSITLLSGEVLFIVRYLDRLINDNPFNPVTNIKVGMNAYITKYTKEEITDESLGNAVKALINTIPSVLKLEDEALLNNIQKEYDSLSENAKTYVTNYQTLENAFAQINTLKQEFEQTKQTLCTELENYPNYSLYSLANQNSIKAIIASNKTIILNTKTLNEATTALASAKALIDKVKTLKQEKIDYFNAEYNKLKNSFVLDNYSTTNQTKIKAELERVYNLINNQIDTITQIKIDEELLASRGVLIVIPNKEEELAVAITSAQDEITTYSEQEKYSASNKDKIDIILYDAFTELSEAKDIAIIPTILSKYKALIDQVPSIIDELKLEKETKIQELEEYKTKYTNNASYEKAEIKQQIDEIVASTKTKITNETNKGLISTYLNDAKQQMNAIGAKDYFEENTKVFDEIDYSLYSSSKKENIERIISNLQTKVENMYQDISTLQIDQLIQSAKEEIEKVETLEEELENVKTTEKFKLANGIVESSWYDVYNQIESIKTQIDAILNQTKTKIDEAKEVNDVYEYAIDAKELINLTFASSYATIKKEQLTSSIDMNKYSLENQKIINEYLASITNNVNENVTKDSIDMLVNAISKNIDEIATKEEELVSYKAEIKNIIENYDAKNIDELKAAALQNLENAKSKEEVDEILSEFKEQVEELSIPKDDKKNCSCMAFIELLTSVSLVLAFALKRKQ